MEQKEAILNNRSAIITLVLAWFGWFFDAFDAVIFSMAIPGMSKELALTGSTLGAITWAFLIIYALGEVVFGYLSDHYGRKRLLSITIGIYAVFTGLTGFVQNAWQLLITRSLTGLGTGGELPVGVALVTESTPSKWRGFAISILIGAYPVGFLFAAWAALSVGAQFGWRTLFFLGIIPALTVVFIRKYMSESPKFVNRKKPDKTEVGFIHFIKSFAVPFRYSPKRSWAAMVSLFAFLFFWWGWATWIPQFLVTEKHLGQIVGLKLVIIYSIVGIPAYFVAGFISDRIGRKKTMMLFMIPAAILLFFYVQQTAASSLLTLGCFMSFFIFGGYGLGIGYPAEFFPAKIRALSYGVTSFYARIASGLSPFLLGVISDKFSLAAGLPILSGVFLICAFIIYLTAPETANQDIEDESEAAFNSVGPSQTVSH